MDKIIQISSGRGPLECQFVVAKVLKVFLEEATEHKIEYEIIQITTVKEKNKVRKSIKIDENTLFDSFDSKQYILKNKDFAKFDYVLDFNIEIPLNIATEKGQIILETQYEGIDFKKTIDSAKFDEGIKQIVASIYEYLLNKSE